MKYVYLSVFLVMTILHLIASYRNHKYFRDLTKGFILFSLLGFYVSMTENINPAIVAAILFSWMGDMFLILKGKIWFICGGTTFGISHICFIIAYYQQVNFDNLPLWVMIVIGVFFISMVTMIFKHLVPHLPKAFIPPMIAYLLVNGTMNSFALFRLISNFSSSSLITVVGALLFFISDSALFFVRFKKDTKQKSHFTVMLTYSLGEFLIILGLI